MGLGGGNASESSPAIPNAVDDDDDEDNDDEEEG